MQQEGHFEARHGMFGLGSFKTSMSLDNYREAYFLREVDAGKGFSTNGELKDFDWEETNPDEILYELISETKSDEEYIFMFNTGSSSKNQLEEIPNSEKHDIKLGNLIGEEKDFSDEMIEKINKNHISKEEIYKISKFKIWTQRHIEKISGNTVAKDTRGGLTEIPLFTKEKMKRIKKKYPQVRYIHLGIIVITIRALFRRGHDIPIIAILLDKRFENPIKALIGGIQSNLHTGTKNSDINDLAEDLAISWTSINEYTNTAEVEIKEINNKIIELFEPNRFTTEIQPKLLDLRDLSIPRDWMMEKINSFSTSKPEEEDNISTNSTPIGIKTVQIPIFPTEPSNNSRKTRMEEIQVMDRGKKPLHQEIVGEWTTVHKKPNKGKAESNSKKGFVHAQKPYYSNQGYYVQYPMPYQIWIIKKIIGTPQLSAVDEDKEHLSKTIDECYNKFENYQVQTGLELLSQAYYLLHDEVYKLWTDGKRILAFPNRNIHEERNGESVKLLKKITEMETEEFPSHIKQKIKNIWEMWNTPPRLSSDSLHLDEIEEMNLDNMQEVIHQEIYHQINDDVSSDESGHDTSSDGSSHKCKHAKWNQP
ncbi:hypothetical protein Gotur_008655 [Gossypium turneri]